MIEVKVTITRKNYPADKGELITLSTQEFNSLRNQINLISQGIDNPPVEKKRCLYIDVADVPDVSDHDKKQIKRFLSQAIARDIRK